MKFLPIFTYFWNTFFTTVLLTHCRIIPPHYTVRVVKHTLLLKLKKAVLTPILFNLCAGASNIFSYVGQLFPCRATY